MKQSGIDFKKLKAQVSLRYGIDLDETALAILAILMEELRRQHITMNKSQEQMAQQIKLSKSALQADAQHPLWQAFFYGMGQWGLALCLAVISVLAIFSIDWNKEQKEKAQLRHELAWYKQQYDEIQKTSPKSGSDNKKSKTKNK